VSSNPRRILVIAVPGFGDALLCTPLTKGLRTAWPDAELHVLVRGSAGRVLEGNTDIDEIIESTRRAGPREVLTMLGARFRSYDLVLSNSASDRMALYALLMGRRRISIVPLRDNGIPWKNWLYHKHIEVDEDNWHIVTRVNKLGELAGIEPGQGVVNPRSPGGHEAIAEHLGAEWDGQPFAVVHPATVLRNKRWQANGWRSVVEHLKNVGLRVIVTGGPGEAERSYVVDELGFAEGSVTYLVGKLRLGDITVLLENCSLYIGVDTLVSHMASSAGAATVVIFGPTNPVKWGPWPFDYNTPVSPYSRGAWQQVGNVYVVNAPDGNLENLAETEVLDAIKTMLDGPEGSK
jgi:heptosyltransferase-3